MIVLDCKNLIITKAGDLLRFGVNMQYDIQKGNLFGSELLILLFFTVVLLYLLTNY